LEQIRTPPLPTTHPALFFLLYLPFGAIGGWLATPIEYLYARAGVSLAAFGAMISLTLFPQVIKVLWAPLVDTTLTLKAWYIVSLAFVAPGILLSGLLPPGAASMGALTALMLVASIASSFTGMACDGLMAHATAPHRRGAAGGWSQAGNVGGAGLAGGGGLWLATRTHSLAAPGWVLAGLCLACALSLLAVSTPAKPARRAGYLEVLIGVGRECWQAVSSRAGRLAVLVFLLPLGAGGAGAVFAAIAPDWGASATLLSNTAWISGVLTSAAAIGGGFVCDFIDRKLAYVLFGVVVGLTAAGMAVAPRTPADFVVFVFAYSAATGLAYAGFAAVTLETIGAGAVATKYTLFASIANIPVAIMPAVDGWVASRSGPAAMLWLELGVALLGALVFLPIWALWRGARLAPERA